MTEPARPYTVVVGVSATSKSPAALRWAAAQAEANDGVLICVRTWRPSAPAATTAGVQAVSGQTTSAAEVEARRQLEEDVAQTLGHDHDAEVYLLRAGKRRGLLVASSQADLLVMDAPRRPSTAPLLAHRVIAVATCPVVVMPPALQGGRSSATAKAGRAFGRALLEAGGRAGRPGYRPPARPRT